MELATLAGGCFWCTEAIFQRLRGVNKVTSGYAGGKGENPSYEQVSSGQTGFAESVQIEFDPKIISYEKILEVFFATHDPTTLNQQGADTGTQYRSVIFYHNEEQKRQVEKSIEKLEKSGAFKNKIVTEIVPLTKFYTAEEYHQKFYEDNKNSHSYCSIVIEPKLEKLLIQFKDIVKEEYKNLSKN